MELYERHCNLAVDYVKLTEKWQSLKDEWDEIVNNIVSERRVPPPDVAAYKASIEQYCVVIATKVGVFFPVLIG